MKRTLTLRREQLSEIVTDDLREVAGATRADSCHMTFGWGCPTDPLEWCLSLNGCIATN